MKSKYLIPLTVILIFYSCAKQVSNEDRIKQTYKFDSVFYLEYNSPKKSNKQDAFGTIDFDKNTIIININIDGQLNSEESTIRKVTSDESSKELKYKTNKGDFSVSIRNDSIIDVSLFTKSNATTFLKAKDKKKVYN